MKKFNSWNNNNNRPYRPKVPFRHPTKFDPTVDTSRELMASFTFRTVKAEYGEDNERLLRRFKRVIEASGILSEIKKREHFKTNGQKRRERHMKAVKNARKRQAKAERWADYDSKKVAPKFNNRRPPSTNPQQGRV